MIETSHKLILAVPCYNEKEVLPETNRQLLEKLSALVSAGVISNESRVLYINDGSKDETWQIIEKLHEEDCRVMGLKLSRNFGHQSALLSGLDYAKDNCDVCISLDADLQDDLDAIDEMLKLYNEDDVHVVYGVRSSRKTDSGFKRGTAVAFYKFMRALGVNSVYNHADYRLMSSSALKTLMDFKEVNLFLRGLVPLVGYKSASVYYTRKERFAGESKYPLRKMLSLAIDGITSFSIKPLRLITAIGFLIFVLSIAFVVYAIIRKVFFDISGGWASTIASIWGIGGIQLLCTGIVGEYIGKIYSEVKGRPRFIVEEILQK
jgi:Glycosyltransferases involved in cell wall biogenesis